MTGCILWTGRTDGQGYGVVRDKPRLRAHVAAFEGAFGPVPTGCILHHRCEIKACVNPAHLEAVTRADHQRLHRPRLKLSDAQVAEIKWLYPGRTQEDLAEQFGVGRSQIGRIVRGEVRNA